MPLLRDIHFTALDCGAAGGHARYAIIGQGATILNLQGDDQSSTG